MSTKTTFKRIALVAVAALGFGMLSVVPSNAAIVPATTSATGAFSPQFGGTPVSASTSANWTVTQIAGANNFVNFIAGNQVTFTAVTPFSVSVVVTGGSVLSGKSSSVLCDPPSSSANTGGSLTASAYASGVWTTGADLLGSSLDSTDCAAVYGTGSVKLSETPASFKIGTPTAGSITASVYASSVSSGVVSTTLLQTFTIVVSPAVSTTFAKTLVDYDSATMVKMDSDGLIHAASTRNTTAARIYASQVNNLGNGLDPTDSKAVSVTLSGNAGSLSAVAGIDPSSSFLYVPAGIWDNLANSGSGSSFDVIADGRTGTATLTIAVNGVTVDTESINFYSTTVASITAVAIYSIAPKGGKVSGYLNADDNANCNAYGLPAVANTGALGQVSTLSCPGLTNRPSIAVISKDATGNVIPVVPTMASSDATVVLPGTTDTFVDNGQGLASAGWGYVHTTYTTATASVSGAKASLTFSVFNANGTVVTSNAVPVTLGGSPSTEVLTLDKAEYQPGESLVVTFTAKDSSGNPVADGTAIPSDLTSTRALNGAALPSTKYYVDGKYSMKADKTFAPSTTGAFKLSATSNNLAGDTLSVTGTVVLDSAISALLSASADAAAEATDAANAATDAANAAAEAADAATAAAQDAADAVAALSAQVAILIAGLKAQLTALTNLIIKIQKKLKA